MSVLTEVLKLFKYDPATDGDMTFNIGQCMNDNWDKLDAAILLAIAAAGAYNPEESYAVGDYCTYKGKLRKCSTAIPTGETWTEAHWTTTTVAAEMQELSSQLSNRLLIHANNAAGLDCNLLIKDGRYQIQSPNILNAPPWIDPTYGHFFIDVFHHMDIWVRQTAYEVNSTRMYTRACLSGSWSQWEPIATATPPQVFDLPLAEGITALQPCTYWKNQFGAVTIGGTAEKSNGVADLTTIATLPESFRPAKNVERPATLSGGGSRYAGSVLIGSNGSVRIHTPTTANVVTFAATFLAAD